MPSAVVFQLGRYRVGFVRINVIQAYRLADFACIQRAFVGQRLERSNCDKMAVYLKEVAQFFRVSERPNPSVPSTL